jgi:hypothetical protein
MGVFQLLLKINDNKAGGDSELFYLTGPNSIEAARTLLNEYIPLRTGILAQGYTIAFGNVSDPEVFRDSLLQNQFSGAQLDGRYGGNAAEAPNNDPIYQRLLIRIEASELYRRSFELLGVPTGILDQYGNYLAPRPWLAPFNAWKTFMLTNGALIAKGRLNSAEPVLPIITLANGATDPRVLIVTVAGDQTASYVAGKLARVSRCTYSLNVDGNWLVDSSTLQGTNTVITLRRRRYPAVFTSGTKLGVITRLIQPVGGVPPSHNFTDIIPQRGVRRKSGRPFPSAHGRQSHQQ